jgi:hypothetical protein
MTAVAIVPAHNEGPRVAAVVAPLRASGRFTRVVVVDDGSRDDTSSAARAAGAEVLRLDPNRGKGGAMLAGVHATAEPVVVFFDADLVGLRPEHAARLVDPVASGQAVMVCGLRDYGPTYNALQAAMPPITGERAVRRDVLLRVPENFWNGFRVEAGINAAACGAGPVWTTVLSGLKIVPKWQKVGVQQGMVDAARMGREVIVAMGDARGIAPAGQAAPGVTVGSDGRIVGVDGMLDQIASALATQAQLKLLPVLQQDTALQERVGQAVGRRAADRLAGPAWLLAGGIALLGVAAIAAVTNRR